MVLNAVSKSPSVALNCTNKPIANRLSGLTAGTRKFLGDFLSKEGDYFLSDLLPVVGQVSVVSTVLPLADAYTKEKKLHTIIIVIAPLPGPPSFSMSHFFVKRQEGLGMRLNTVLS